MNVGNRAEELVQEPKRAIVRINGGIEIPFLGFLPQKCENMLCLRTTDIAPGLAVQAIMFPGWQQSFLQFISFLAIA